MSRYNVKCDPVASVCLHRDYEPKLTWFDDAFPGKIGFTDIDGIVEINGHYLVLEWKSPHGVVTDGQRTMLERLPDEFSVIIARGDPKTGHLNSVTFRVFGTWTHYKYGEFTLSDMKSWIKKWAAWAKQQEIINE